MIKNFLPIIAVILLTACSSEPKPEIKLKDVSIDKSDKEEMRELKVALSKYTQATIDNDVDTLVKFVYPKAFTIVSKEKMIKMLNRAFKSGRVPKVKDVKHLKIEPIKKYDKGIYSIITSSMTTIVKSPKPTTPEVENYMLETFKSRLGSQGSVKFDKDKHLFYIQHSNKTIALNENGGWKFIGFTQAKKYVNKGIFPKSLIEKIE